MGARHSRLAASLAVAWEYEVNAARRLDWISERMSSEEARSKLRILSSFCRAHASRVLSRLAGLGRGPLPVPLNDENELPLDVSAAILLEIENARSHAERYRRMLEVARHQVDLSTAWVCELNRSEEQERVKELQRIWVRTNEECSQIADYPPPLLDV